MGELLQVRQWQDAPAARAIEILLPQVVTAACARTHLSPCGVAKALNHMSPRHPGVLPAAVESWQNGIGVPPADLYGALLTLAGVDVVGRLRELLGILAS